MNSRISVLIPTKNEEHDIESCLAGLSWCDDIHVFDSFSTDRTVEIARGMGARVVARQFDGYASQKNAALRSLPFKYEWVLLLDADERVPVALVHEMSGFVASAPQHVTAARIQRRDFFWGTWLRHAQISPYYLRLVRHSAVHFEREVNEILVPNGAVVSLHNYFDHFPFSKGIAHWIEKHNRYSSMEALRAENERMHTRFSLSMALFASDFHERRIHQKGLFFRLPCRPIFKFMYMVIFRRALLDGRAGIAYSILQSIYEYFIVLKQNELRSKSTSRGPLP